MQATTKYSSPRLEKTLNEARLPEMIQNNVVPTSPKAWGQSVQLIAILLDEHSIPHTIASAIHYGDYCAWIIINAQTHISPSLHDSINTNHSLVQLLIDRNVTPYSMSSVVSCWYPALQIKQNVYHDKLAEAPDAAASGNDEVHPLGSDYRNGELQIYLWTDEHHTGEPQKPRATYNLSDPNALYQLIQDVIPLTAIDYKAAKFHKRRS